MTESRPTSPSIQESPVIRKGPVSQTTQKKSFQKRSLGMIIGGVVLLLLLAGAVAAFFLSQQQQDLRQRAAGPDNCCGIDRQCSSDAEWIAGYYAYQNGQCGGGGGGGGSTATCNTPAKDCSAKCKDGSTKSDWCPATFQSCQAWANEACGGPGNVAEVNNTPVSTGGGGGSTGGGSGTSCTYDADVSKNQRTSCGSAGGCPDGQQKICQAGGTWGQCVRSVQCVPVAPNCSCNIIDQGGCEARGYCLWNESSRSCGEREGVYAGACPNGEGGSGGGSASCLNPPSLGGVKKDGTPFNCPSGQMCISTGEDAYCVGTGTGGSTGGTGTGGSTSGTIAAGQPCDHAPDSCAQGSYCTGVQGSRKCNVPGADSNTAKCTAEKGVCGNNYIAFKCNSLDARGECHDNPKFTTSYQEALAHAGSCGQVDQVCKSSGAMNNQLCGGFVIMSSGCGGGGTPPSTPPASPAALTCGSSCTSGGQACPANNTCSNGKCVLTQCTQAGVTCDTNKCTVVTGGGACMNITLSNSTPQVGDNVTFTCGQVAGAVKYEFRVQLPNGTFQTVAASATDAKKSTAFKISQPGKYTGQCRICTGTDPASCQPFETIQ